MAFSQVFTVPYNVTTRFGDVSFHVTDPKRIGRAANFFICLVSPSRRHIYCRLIKLKCSYYQDMIVSNPACSRLTTGES